MIMIALVGEQPMPVLLPLWQWDEITAVQLFATQTTMSVADSLANFIKKEQFPQKIEVYKTILVEAYDLYDVTEKIKEAISAFPGEKVLINLTSGTKIMSLGAAMAAEGRGNAKLLYVNTQDSRMLTYKLNEPDVGIEEICVNITVAQYLGAHGFLVTPNQNPEATTAPVRQPRAGDWLEDKLYTQCQESGFFDDVQLNRFIHKPIDDTLIPNEIDVMVTKNGNLGVCSCKTGGLNTKMLNELSTLASRISTGIYCKKFLVTSNDKPSDDFCNRAKKEFIQIIDGNNLDNAAEIISKAFDKKKRES